MHVHDTSSWPGLFLSAGPEFLERGEFFKQNFPRDRPSKKLVSIFSPCRSSDKIQRLRFRHKSTSVRLSSSIATLGQVRPEQSSFCSFIKKFIGHPLLGSPSEIQEFSLS